MHSCTIYTGVPYCRSPWRAMEHGANATQLFAFVGGDRYGPPATTVRGIVTATARYGPSATTARLAPRQTLCTHPATL